MANQKEQLLLNSPRNHLSTKHLNSVAVNIWEDHLQLKNLKERNLLIMMVDNVEAIANHTAVINTPKAAMSSLKPLLSSLEEFHTTQLLNQLKISSHQLDQLLPLELSLIEKVARY
jgi:hypothetical protein